MEAAQPWRFGIGKPGDEVELSVIQLPVGAISRDAGLPALFSALAAREEPITIDG